MKKNLFRFLFLASLCFSFLPAYALTFTPETYLSDSATAITASCIDEENHYSIWILESTNYPEFETSNPCFDDYNVLQGEMYDFGNSAGLFPPIEPDFTAIIIEWDASDENADDCDYGDITDCRNSTAFIIEKNFYVVSTLAGGYTTINLPFASTSDMLASAGALFTDLWVIIVLAIGIPLAFVLIEWIIGLQEPKKY